MLTSNLMVNLRNGEAISGILSAQSGDLLVLLGATLFVEGRAPQRLDGRAIIPLDSATFVQEIPPAVAYTPAKE